MHIYKGHDFNAHFIHGGLAEALVHNTLDKLVDNVASMRKQWMERASGNDPRRNLNAECGYPDEISPQQYQCMYERDGIAKRVVDWLVDECWQRQPLIYEVEETKDKSEKTPFEQDFANLGKGFRGKSWLKTEKDSPIFSYCKRAQRLARCGRYSIIVVGIDDGTDLSKPVKGVSETGSVPVGAVRKEVAATNGMKAGFVVNCPPAKDAMAQPYVCNADGVEPGRQLVYLRVFAETEAEIAAFEMNSSSPRFGQPTSYSVTFGDNESGQGTTTKDVHWTRVVHVAHTKRSSEVFADPALEASANRIFDLQKLYGGSAEMFWQGGFPGLVVEGLPAFAGELSFDADEMRDTMEKYFNGLQRYLAFTNASAKTLSPTVANPAPHIDKHLEAICIEQGYPKRKFMGSEVGQLASETDDGTANDRIMEHQQGHLTYGVVGALIDRLIWVRVLREPAEENGYKVDWTDLNATSAKDKAAIAVQLTQALAQYASGGAEQFMTFPDYLVRIWGWSEEDANAVEDARQQVAETQAAQGEMDQATVDGAIDEPTPEDAQPLPDAAAMLQSRLSPPSDVQNVFVPPPGSKVFSGTPPKGWTLAAVGPDGGKYYVPGKNPAQQPNQPDNGKPPEEGEAWGNKPFKYKTQINGVNVTVERKRWTRPDGTDLGFHTSVKIDPYKGPPPADNPNLFKKHTMSQEEFSRYSSEFRDMLQKHGVTPGVTMYPANRIDAAVNLLIDGDIEHKDFSPSPKDIKIPHIGKAKMGGYISGSTVAYLFLDGPA